MKLIYFTLVICIDPLFLYHLFDLNIFSLDKFISPFLITNSHFLKIEIFF